MLHYISLPSSFDGCITQAPNSNNLSTGTFAFYNLHRITLLYWIPIYKRREMPIETWGKIWEYFSNENSQYIRAYKTDFEYYKNENEIEIYISVQ